MKLDNKEDSNDEVNKLENSILDNSEELVSFKQDNLEIYSRVKLNTLIDIKDENVQLINGEDVVYPKKLGKQEFEVYFKYNDQDYVYKKMINVEDTTAPMAFGSTYVSANVGYDKDICGLIKYGDNYTKEVKCEVVGNYNLNQVGTYNLVYNLIDESNNVTKTNVTLNVVRPSSGGSGGGTSSPAPKTEFREVYEKYKNEDTEIGIDVSEWQGKIDFEKVKEAGASFVIIRIGAEGNGGVIKEDAYYKENIKNAKAAGLKVGVYLYSIAISEEEAIKHSEWVLDTLEGEELDLPIVFDWESWSYWNMYKISFFDINNVAEIFMNRVEQDGYKGMLYSSAYYLNKIWYKNDNYPIWLAYYTSNNDYEGDYKYWQLCSDGHIDGVNGSVDINVMYK